MPTLCRIITKEGTSEITEKRSRFLGHAVPVSSEAEAAAFLEATRKRLWDCKHHCSAFVIGDGGELTRCSDDGEPSGTAGRPILDALAGSGIRNACVVVSRYFGGTLLGTGGLVRAYSEAARLALAACETAEKRTGFRLTVTCPYDRLGKLQYAAADLGLKLFSDTYGTEVLLEYLSPEEAAEAARARLTDVTGGRARIDCSDRLVYAETENGVRFF